MINPGRLTLSSVPSKVDTDDMAGPDNDTHPTRRGHAHRSEFAIAGATH